MSRGFVASGKLGALSPTRTLGVAVPIVGTAGPGYDGCPAGYSRNALGVCMVGPGIVSGVTTVYSGPLVMAGHRRR